MDAPGHGSLDRVGGSVRRTGDASFVVDLGGNLAEWALDRWSRADEAYWSAVRVFTNPVADLLSPGDGDERPVRGGSWLEPATETAAAIRNFNAPTVEGVGRSVGFRCARAGT
jgi:formylglycine-generating enzyme required for sulfatase activity